MKRINYFYFLILFLVFGCLLHSGNGWAGLTYYHSDYLGSSSVLSNSDGSVLGETQYYPYGSSFSDSMSGLTSYKYTDQEEDSETEAYYYGARYYDPNLAKFLSVDPIFFSGLSERIRQSPKMINAYSYSGNNPIKNIDAGGLASGESAKFMGDTQFKLQGMMTGLLNGDLQCVMNAKDFLFSAASAVPESFPDNALAFISRVGSPSARTGDVYFNVMIVDVGPGNYKAQAPGGQASTYIFSDSPIQFSGVIFAGKGTDGTKSAIGYGYDQAPSNMSIAANILGRDIAPTDVGPTIISLDTIQNEVNSVSLTNSRIKIPGLLNAKVLASHSTNKSLSETDVSFGGSGKKEAKTIDKWFKMNNRSDISTWGFLKDPLSFMPWNND